MIYFDNAATTFPKPACVRRGVDGYFSVYGANPGRAGHEMAIKTAMEVYKTRELTAKLFHSNEPEQVVFALNCTHALNLAIKGTVHQGGHVIISDMEHNSVLRTVHALSLEGKASYSIAETVPGNPRATVEAFEKLIQNNTQLICCIQGSNVFGTRLPVEQLCALARAKGIPMLVDAAQTAGVLDINLTKTPYEFVAMAGHKGLYGPTGTGILITSIGEQVEPLMHGGTGSNSVEPVQPDFMPDRLECGTVNTAGIVALGQGVRHVLATGPSKIYAHELEICKYLYRFLRNCRSAVLYTPEPEIGECLPVLSFNYGSLSGEETAAKLAEKGFGLRGGLHCAPLAHKKIGTLERGTARISPGCFNTMEQAELLCRAIKSL